MLCNNAKFVLGRYIHLAELNVPGLLITPSWLPVHWKGPELQIPTHPDGCQLTHTDLKHKYDFFIHYNFITSITQI